MGREWDATDKGKLYRRALSRAYSELRKYHPVDHAVLYGAIFADLERKHGDTELRARLRARADAAAKRRLRYVHPNDWADLLDIALEEVAKDPKPKKREYK